MKHNKFLIIAIVAITVFFTACSSEEDDFHANQEVVLQVGMGGSRSTPDGTWTVGDFIAVDIGGVVKQYVVTDATGTAEGYDTDNTFYWEDLGGSTSVEISAWSLGGKYISSLSDSIPIAADQTEDADFIGSDFLYAPTITVNKGGTAELTFYHQMTRINFYINADVATNIESVTIGNEDEANIPLKGLFEVPSADATTGAAVVSNYGYFDVGYYNFGYIIAHQESVPEGSNYQHAYSGIIMPSNIIESLSCYIKTSDGTTYSFYPYDFISITSGAVLNFYLTIKNKELTISDSKVPVSVTDWGS